MQATDGLVMPEAAIPSPAKASTFREKH